MYKKLLILLFCVLTICALPHVYVNAEDNEVGNEKEYKPLDIVIVIDESGSMRTSDPDETAKEAVRMLVNMMPAEDSRVGVISFNTEPTVRTEGKYGDDALIKIRDFAGLESVRDAIDEVEYKGDTGIGNALNAATELLSKESDDTRTKVIMLFTDGVDDFGNRIEADLELAKCQKKETEAISWAKDNDCKIYCVGYDYVLQNGDSSMGENGEGIVKLQNMANTTGGEFNVVHDVSEIEELLIRFLASACDLNYKIIETIPGDGNRHEAVIPISPSVIEANIRIAGADTSALESGSIHLYDPNGDEVLLENSENVRVDADAMAVSIKVIVPKAGDWVVSVEGIYNEINIGLLEHYKMNISSTLTFPEGNPEGVAYSNDTVGIKTWLSYEGETLEESAIYDAVTSAKAKCVSRADNDEIVIDLVRDGNAFVGDFTIPQDSYYDIYIRLDWDTVFREDTLTVKSSNKPLELASDIDDVVVNKGKNVEINNIFQFVKDDEGDEITLNAIKVGNEEIASVLEKDDTLVVSGKKWGSTLVEVEYLDANGNTVETSFQIEVNDPVALALIIGSFILIIFGVLAFLYISYRLSFRIGGKIRVASIQRKIFSDGVEKERITLYEDAHRKGNKNEVKDFSSSENENLNDSFFDNDMNSDNSFSDDLFGDFFDDNIIEENDSSDGSVLSDSEEISKSQEFYAGEFPLAAINSPDLLAVVERFKKLYVEYMTDDGRVISKKASFIQECVENSMSSLSFVKIKGSPFGRNGVSFDFSNVDVKDEQDNKVVSKGKKNSPTFILYNQRLKKKQISARGTRNKLFIIKLGMDVFSDEQSGNKEEICIEIEYINN